MWRMNIDGVEQLFPWGSHPEVDPWFSNEECSLVHARCDVTRLDKTAVVAASHVALENLRIRRRSAFNCGSCNRCVRTRLGLQALRVSSPCFAPDPLSLRQVRRSSISEHSMKYFTEIADFLRNEGRDLPLADAIDEACSRERHRGWRGRLRHTTQTPSVAGRCYRWHGASAYARSPTRNYHATVVGEQFPG